MPQIRIVPKAEFDRVRAVVADRHARAALVADLCRLNTLSEVKLAGSGHLGSSFSAMDLVAWLYLEELNVLRVGFEDPARDIYFSSKGHDVPGFYAVMHALGALDESQLLRLRRLGGPDGHPNLGDPGVEANSGSLGMGVGKAKGMALAKRMLGVGGRVHVLLGDGELQEGQIWESLQTAAHQRVANLTAILDRNACQTDKPVCEIVDTGDLVAKFREFGWHVERIDGHDLRAIEAALARCRAVADRPQAIVAETIKGRGVSFMEHPAALAENAGLYPWHAGAPKDDVYERAFDDLFGRISKDAAALGVGPVALRDVTPEPAPPSGVTKEFVAEAYGRRLLEWGEKRRDIVVLDGDLAADCRVRAFEEKFPDRFVENGIAEQDMVSTAGGLARLGMLPVVNSFVSFLASRANEQIYNNAGEGTKIVYACHYAGMLPAGPGKSHQSIRDISLFGALPNCAILQPCNARETEMVVDYAIGETKENVAIRLAIGPSPRLVVLPDGYELTFGQGVALTEGRDAALFAYGPAMIHEALTAARLLREKGVGLAVVNMPWLNRFDRRWLKETIEPYRDLFVLEDHAPVGGLGDRLLDALAGADLLEGRRFRKFAVEGFPACGTPGEALRAHRLDGISLARRIMGEEEDAGTTFASAAGAGGGFYTTDAPQ